MGKLNIRAKAKAAVKRLKSSLETPAANKSQQTAGNEEKMDLLLHKTSKATITKKTSKREKFKQKHKKLMNKFAEQNKQRKEDIAKKNREKTAVIGDLKPLKDSLPSLEELFKLKKKPDELKTGLKINLNNSLDDEDDENAKKELSKKKISAKEKIRKKKEDFVNRVKAYESLLNDSDFQENPRETIAFHVKYTNGLIKD